MLSADAPLFPTANLEEVAMLPLESSVMPAVRVLPCSLPTPVATLLVWWWWVQCSMCHAVRLWEGYALPSITFRLDVATSLDTLQGTWVPQNAHGEDGLGIAPPCCC